MDSYASVHVDANFTNGNLILWCYSKISTFKLGNFFCTCYINSKMIKLIVSDKLKLLEQAVICHAIRASCFEFNHISTLLPYLKLKFHMLVSIR